MLVERVDIVTGGVSAVYGSDAVSGVVNYIINKKFTGLRAEASSGLTEYGDATKVSAAVAYGTNIGDRGHVEFSYEYRDEGGVGRRSNRSWLNQWGVTGAGTTANPYVLSGNLRQSGFPFGGLITTGALVGQNFRSDGVLAPFANGSATGTSGIQVGGDGGYWDSGLVARLSGHQIFGRFDYKLTDGIKFYAQVGGTFKTNSNVAETNQLNQVFISRTNAFLSPAIQAMIPVAQPTFRLSKFLGNAPRVSADAESEQWVYMTGLSGGIGDWNWTIDYVHGLSKLDTAMHNVINRQKLGYALDAVPSGSSVVCNVTLSNPGLANDCVPLNPFGPTAASAASIDYITDDIFYNATTKMDDISGSVSGSLFDIGAGPLNAALSAEWRKVTFSSTSTARPTDLISCTGIRFGNCTATNTLLEVVFGESPAPVSQTVWEVAGEFDLPLLKNKPLFQALSINGAARYTHYNTSGNYWTWKAGILWEISDALRFRVTRSRDIRAPSLYELFSPSTIVQIRATDLLTGLSPTVSSIDSSNPDLVAEIANTLTAGMVFKPTSRLSFAVDFYKIDIGGAITQIQGQTPSFQTACYASGGTSPYCAQQIRLNGFTDASAANVVQGWRSLRINIAEVKTWGIDFEANYQGELFGRPMLARVLAAWQPHLRYVQPGITTIDQAGVGFGPVGLGATPSFRLTGIFRFKPADNLTIDIIERWRNALKLSGDPTQVFVDGRMDAFGTTTINVAWDVEGELGDMQFFFNVQNLFNTHPPQGAFSGNGTRAGLRDGFAIGDDPRGRSYTAGVKLKL